jgi:hypothetical protein
MKIYEVISEAKLTQKKISKRQSQSSKGVNTFSDGEKASGDYTMNRLGMALAMTDGKSKPDIEAKSWIGKSKGAFPYTKEEQDMLKQAYKAVGADHKDLNKGNLNSMELEDTNKISAVAKVKKNKYGV